EYWWLGRDRNFAANSPLWLATRKESVKHYQVPRLVSLLTPSLANGTISSCRHVFHLPSDVNPPRLSVFHRGGIPRLSLRMARATQFVLATRGIARRRNAWPAPW